ncbi:MAG: S46 family peptidase [Gemmatimonadota bacterium]|nr:S46 family peptidase [Gemmatimonadota bacterium]
MEPSHVKRWIVLAAAASLAGCASSGTPAPESAIDLPAAEARPPQDQAATGLLAPPAAAVRAADHVELSGTEMGTMWTFENPPLEYWAETYGFRPSSEWLDHVRLSSVRYGGGCSASFVSADGLVMTNHHCARGCVDAVAGEGEDFLIDGFYAGSRDEERVCPGLFLDQLVEIRDITSEVHGAAEHGMSDAEAAGAQETRGEELAAACETETGLECQVVSLFHGGQYKLYVYKRHQPVKLVFAPELQTGFFGGDPDNFTYPRYALDVSFVRAYEADGSTPATPGHHFGWDPEGAEEDELVFVSGNPGSTARQIAVSQFMYEREIWHPMLLDFFDQRLEIMHGIAARDPERGRAMQNQIFGFENTQKLFRGELKGLRDTLLVAKKIRWENEFRSAVEADPALAAEYGDVWSRLAQIQETKARIAPSVFLNNTNFLVPSQHLQRAGLLLQYVEEMARPEAERSPQFQGESAERMRQVLEAPAPIAEDMSVGMLTGRLALARKWLDEGPLLAAVGAAETPEAAARRLISSSRIGDASFRTGLLEGGPAAVAASADPMIALARDMRAAQEAVLPAWQQADASESVQAERFAQALFAVYGTDLPPDATFTLRITDGIVKRYAYNGTFAPAATSIFGFYARASEFGNEMPWTMPDSWRQAKDRIDMSVPLNFVTTNDITGGNSGSPVIDADARVVGIAFDGNIEAFPNEFLFAAENGRTVAVHSAGILEALRSVYGATALVEELTAQD